MSLVGFANSRWGPTAGISLARLLPHGLAQRLAKQLAHRIARQRDSELARAIKANQARVRGLPPNDPSLELAAEQVILAAARGYLSLFRVMRRGLNELSATTTVDPRIVDIAMQALDQRRGVIIVAPHTAGFDHLLLHLAGLGLPVQVLSYPQPKGSYSTQNNIRMSFGLNVTPINFEALRAAIGLLRRGGLVLLGVDRPDPAGEELEFFGRPARLPVGHARLAWRTGASVLFGVCQSDGDSRYRAIYAGLLEADRRLQEMAAARALAQQGIRLVEGFIAQRPQEWLMFHPVWGAD